MEASHYKSWFGVWLPFGLRRIDLYFIRAYIKAFILIFLALAALISIGDMFQRFDDFLLLAKREEQDLAQSLGIFARYYATHIPQLIFQYMFPVIMLLAASITATSAYSGPRGNNEYIVIRSAGIPVLRSLFPLLLPAFLVALLFQGSRDVFLPTMVRESRSITNRLRHRISNPTSITVIGEGGLQSIAIGSFTHDSIAHNVIIEVRDLGRFQRGDSRQGDNDFVTYRANAALLETAPDGSQRWTPIENGKVQTFTRFSRSEEPWTKPVPTSLTPAMIERQTLGDAVSTWEDLLFLQNDNSGAKFEMHWRMAEPIACCLLVLWGTGLCMGRMLRGASASYIHAVTVSMLAAGFFYIFRLAGKSLWESGTLTPELGVWLPIAAAATVALFIAFWMER